MLKLKIVVGSTRDGRAADHVVPWVRQRAVGSGDFDVEVLDLRDWALPMFAESIHTLGDLHDPEYSQPQVRRWNDAIGDADALLVITPEYNHSIPAVLKNAIDSVFFSFALRHKPVGFVGYSMGAVGGARAVEHLVHVAVEAEAVPMRNSVLIPVVHNAFDEAGDPVSDATQIALTILLEDLRWWGDVLRDARSDSLPPAMFRTPSKQQRAAS